MKARYFGTTLIAALATVSLSACVSNHAEIVIPANPSTPSVGAEVSQEVIYQANPRFFATDNCFSALTAEVKNIAATGCDVLWIMPIQEPGRKNAIGSPYCIRDYKKINSKYGTMADFKALVDAAHAAGMRVMLDWVANHTAWDHSWISEHPDYYVRDAAGNIQQANTWTDVAQLDFNNPDTEAAMIDAMKFWVSQGNIDGLRCDYAEGPGHKFWAHAIEALRAVKPELEMLGETSDPSYYADGFDSVYDWNFAPAMSKVFKGGKPSDLFKKAAETWSAVPEGKDLLRYTFNHDFAAENSIDGAYGSIDALPAAYVLTAMLNGMPMIYSSMDADNVSGKLNFFNYQTMSWSAEKRATYRAINDAYRASAEVRRGELTTYNDPKVAVFTRTTPEHKMLVMVNTTDEEMSVKIPITLVDRTMTDLINGGDTKMPVNMSLGAYGYVIYME